MMIKILVAVAAVLALLVGPAGQTAAAPKPQSISYSYQATLTDSDGTTRNYAVTASVQYQRDGSATTTCVYSTYPPGSSVLVTDGYYRVAYAIADTSRAGVLRFCTDSFPNRTRV